MEHAHILNLYRCAHGSEVEHGPCVRRQPLYIDPQLGGARWNPAQDGCGA